jgi:hypothetical protein
MTKQIAKALLIMAVAGLCGCASMKPHLSGDARIPSTLASLQFYLERWSQWRAFSSDIKLAINTPETKGQVKGHLLCLSGERYELGFAKPYNQLLGNLYVTPEQLIYWDIHNSPKSFAIQDTVALTDLASLPMPRWNPRDILPFPMCGRTSGFQVDSVVNDAQVVCVFGRSNEAAYQLRFDRQGRIVSEIVHRNGADLMMKSYSRFRKYRGWPIATRVVCEDSEHHTQFRWKIGSIQLEAANFPPIGE